MKLPLKTVSMKFMLFIAISSLFLSPASAKDDIDDVPALIAEFLEAGKNKLGTSREEQSDFRDVKETSDFRDVKETSDFRDVKETSVIIDSRVVRLRDLKVVHIFNRLFLWAYNNGCTNVMEQLLKYRNTDPNNLYPSEYTVSLLCKTTN